MVSKYAGQKRSPTVSYISIDTTWVELALHAAIVAMLQGHQRFEPGLTRCAPAPIRAAGAMRSRHGRAQLARACRVLREAAPAAPKFQHLLAAFGVDQTQDAFVLGRLGILQAARPVTRRTAPRSRSWSGPASAR